MITDHTIRLPVSAPIASFAFQLLATLWSSNPTVPSSHSQNKSKQKRIVASDRRTNTRLTFNIKKSADMSPQRACLLGVATKLSSRPLSVRVFLSLYVRNSVEAIEKRKKEQGKKDEKET